VGVLDACLFLLSFELSVFSDFGSEAVEASGCRAAANCGGAK
jgi:hypothetical protein